MYSQLLFDLRESKLPLQRQLSHDTGGLDVWLLSNPLEHVLHGKLSSKCSLHLMHEIVPLDNTLHAADDRFLRHQVQWKSNFSVKSTKKGKMQCFTYLSKPTLVFNLKNNLLLKCTCTSLCHRQK